MELSIAFIPHFIIQRACGLLPSGDSIPLDFTIANRNSVLCFAGVALAHYGRFI
jgi:hypothetical protein